MNRMKPITANVRKMSPALRGYGTLFQVAKNGVVHEISVCSRDMAGLKATMAEIFGVDTLFDKKRAWRVVMFKADAISQQRARSERSERMRANEISEGAKEMKKAKAAAVVTIHHAAKMTPSGRKRIAKWLRSRASYLEKHADLMAARFTSRWLY